MFRWRHACFVVLLGGCRVHAASRRDVPSVPYGGIVGDDGRPIDESLPPPDDQVASDGSADDGTSSDDNEGDEASDGASDADPADEDPGDDGSGDPGDESNLAPKHTRLRRAR